MLQASGRSTRYLPGMLLGAQRKQQRLGRRGGLQVAAPPPDHRQRRLAAVVRHVQPGAVFDEQLDDPREALVGDVVQRRATGLVRAR